MLPFIEIPSYSLGPLTLQAFGPLVVIGILSGTSVASRYAARYRMDDETLRWLGVRVLVFGFITCHILDAVFYTPDKLKEDPLLIFRLWEGIASYGGILGAFIAFTIYHRVRKFHYLRYGDAIVYGFSLGMMFGRMGCATAHDHLGKETDFFLGVTLPPHWNLPGVPAGATVHDLGFYGIFVWLSLFLILNAVMAFWKSRPPGTLIAVAAFYYAPIRFFLDFLRLPHSDPRYWGLTPAQHLTIWTVVGGIAVLIAQRRLTGADKSLYAPEGEVGDNSSVQDAKPKPKAKVVRKKKRK